MADLIAEPCIDVADWACVEECPGRLQMRVIGRCISTPMMHRLWSMRAGLPDRGGLLRGRRARRVVELYRR
jgi:hypothetical protein